MQSFAYTYWLGIGGVQRTAILAESLPFSPVRLVILVVWVYLCLFCVQRVRFSPLVPKNFKAAGYAVALFLGPALFLVLHLVDVVKQSTEGHKGFIKTIKEQLENSRAAVMGSEKDWKVRLRDSSGRSISELYNRSKTKRQDSRILELASELIGNALEQQASDILIDPKNQSVYTVRYRVDGVLRTVDQIDAETCHAIINSIKVVSSMDISEKRRPQDGSFLADYEGTTVSFRAASAGVRSGEKLSIRVLNQNAGTFTLENIGLTEKQHATIEAAISKPSGMILICGPTGSGKTTTMYAMLNRIDLTTRNVITVEDPIEYVLPNASQIEVNPKAGITFANTLRSILRQDPDVICVGEIRDEETASIALRAAQTGHLVLATIHSNSNASALVRLLDLGISRVLMASGISLLVSQRLLRRLCENCREPADLTPSQVHRFHKKGINCRKLYEAKGCSECHWTGYRGRTAIFDLLAFTDELKADIVNNDLLVTQLRKNGDRKGRSNLQKQGLKRVVSGITTFGELKRVIG